MISQVMRGVLGFSLALLLCHAPYLRGQGVVGNGREVSLELVLALDSSVSVDAREYMLQIGGLARAFRDPAVIAAIRDAGDNGIAVSVIQWGVGLQQLVAVDWTNVRDGATAEALAREIETSPRYIVGNGTGITRALVFASKQFEGNGFAGRRRIIDVSGDGRNNSGASPAMVRDRLVALGFTINGLAILDGDTGLNAYYADNVIGGPAAFVVTASTFEDFADAIRAKLLREITVPMAARTPRPSRIVPVALRGQKRLRDPKVHREIQPRSCLEGIRQVAMSSSGPERNAACSSR
jgi:hypothetical protein